MKKNLLKRIGAVALALAVSLTMGTAAFAASDSVTGDYDANKGSLTTYSTENNTITLSKTIVYFNPDSTSVREPDIDYTYTVAPATVATGTTVKDNNGNGPVTVYAGVSAGITAPSAISINPGTAIAASSTGNAKVYTTTIGVKPSEFSHAGIYRYLITESTTDADVAAAGVLRASSTDNEKRYLDVYIKNGDNGLEFQGAVIFKTNESIDGSQEGKYTSKTIGFDVADAEDKDFSDDATVDKYFTYNLKVTKAITGGMADKTHPFPIEIALAKATGLTNDATVDVSANTNATVTSGATTSLGSSATVKGTVKDGGEIYIKGIPYFPGATAAYATISSVKETNDTSDAYTPSITTKTDLTDGSTAMTFDGQAMEAGASKTTNGTEILKDSKYEPVLGVTNNATEISPTNVVMRFAPYLFILGAAIVLLVLMRRRRASQDAE